MYLSFPSSNKYNLKNVHQRKQRLDKCHLLETAARKGQLEIVRLLLRVGLLENGADIDAIFKGLNCTPLDIAVLNKKTSITKLLLENGCKTNIRNHKGQTALEVAMNRGYLDGVKQLAFNDQ